MKLQKDLTRPPIIFGQLPPETIIRHVYDQLTAQPTSILSRPVKPSFMVGTRAQLSSALAYMSTGPSHNHNNNTHNNNQQFVRFRQIYTMCSDGAQIGVDWEVTNTIRQTEIMTQKIIRHPVVIILHGINNHSQFGYMKSLQRTFCLRGWNAVAVNFRGCGGVPLTTPRAYNAAYTGDLRSLVLQISTQLQKGVPIFLVGNSLGANLVTKYLGEEGLAGTLPEAVAGGISLGNPMIFRTNRVKFPHNVLMGLARKKGYWDQRHAVKEMNDPLFATAKKNATRSQTLGGLDQSVVPVMIRNSPYPPFEIRIGYESADEYWTDSSCYEESRFISVPFMHVTAADDFLCHERFKSLLGYALSNPNIIVVETRTGGHLGFWHQSNPESSPWWSVDSWANGATADFIQAIMVAHNERGLQCDDKSRLDELKLRLKEEARTVTGQIKSNL